MGRVADGLNEFVHRVDRRYGWHRLPTPLGVLALTQMRLKLRRENLFATSVSTGLDDALLTGKPSDLSFRTIDGTCNDLNDPRWARTGSRFGRNVPIDDTLPERRRG